MTRITLTTLLLVLVVSGGVAQSTLPPGCPAAEHRQFDFWAGSWTVTDSAGAVLGENHIVPIAGGCGLHEHWRGARGGEGMSLTVWQPRSSRWTQFWVGTGVVLHLVGGLDAQGRMVLQGGRESPEGPLRDRITWSPSPDGGLRQEWDLSNDGGRTWRRIFAGTYRRRSPTRY